jgi:hypothetical protein
MIYFDMYTHCDLLACGCMRRREENECHERRYNIEGEELLAKLFDL